jgi:hypothetical protein
MRLRGNIVVVLMAWAMAGLGSGMLGCGSDDVSREYVPAACMCIGPMDATCTFCEDYRSCACGEDCEVWCYTEDRWRCGDSPVACPEDPTDGG